MEMSEQEVIEGLRRAVREYDPDLAREYAQKAVEAGIDPVKALEEGLAKALREIGDKFGRGEIFLTELVAAAQAMEAGAEVLKKKIMEAGRAEYVGRFLIGTVEGDIHSLGKGIVAAMLMAAGFEVIDLGEDVPTQVFVEKVRELKPDILGLSALMTTTMAKQKEVIDALKAAGLRDKVKVIVGGAPVTDEWAKQIGADACGMDATDAVRRALELLGRKVD